MAEVTTPRRADRVPLRADIDFRRAGGNRYRVTILDFSPQGCRIEAPVRVDPGDIIWISFPGLESLQARVCWSEGWTAGVQFDRPLYPSVFDMIRDRIAR